MAKRYTVRVNAPSTIGTGVETRWDYPAGYFPRGFHYKRDAIACAKQAVEKGATLARVDCPDGGELDYRPLLRDRGVPESTESLPSGRFREHRRDRTPG